MRRWWRRHDAAGCPCCEEEGVAKGRREVIRAGLRLLEDNEDRLAALRRALREGAAA